MKTTLLLVAGLAAVLAGCASNPKPQLTKAQARQVNWTERIGNFTLAQAQADLGRPVLTGESSAGQFAEWVLRRSPQVSFGLGLGTGSYGRHSGVGVGVGTSVSPPPSGEYLRLTFGPDGQLKEWSKVKY